MSQTLLESTKNIQSIMCIPKEKVLCELFYRQRSGPPSEWYQMLSSVWKQHFIICHYLSNLDNTSIFTNIPYVLRSNHLHEDLRIHMDFKASVLWSGHCKIWWYPTGISSMNRAFFFVSNGTHLVECSSWCVYYKVVLLVYLLCPSRWVVLVFLHCVKKNKRGTKRNVSRECIEMYNST